MLAMADRLFMEFDHIPVGRVFTAFVRTDGPAGQCRHGSDAGPDESRPSNG
jgi:hypothetical protein